MKNYNNRSVLLQAYYLLSNYTSNRILDYLVDRSRRWGSRLYMSNETIHEDLDIPLRTVERYMASLYACGVITLIKRRFNNSNVFEVSPILYTLHQELQGFIPSLRFMYLGLLTSAFSAFGGLSRNKEEYIKSLEEIEVSIDGTVTTATPLENDRMPESYEKRERIMANNPFMDLDRATWPPKSKIQDSTKGKDYASRAWSGHTEATDKDYKHRAQLKNQAWDRFIAGEFTTWEEACKALGIKW